MTQSAMKLGMNKTGLTADRGMPPPPDGEQDLDLGKLALGSMMLSFQEQAPRVGSIPPPDTGRGVAGAAVQALKGNKLHVYVDKLGERLAFERGGVRLYDALLSKYDTAKGSARGLPPRDAIEAIREEELEHVHLLSRAIEQLGCDPTAVTPSADLVGVQALGLMQVLADPRVAFGDSLNAIFTAERVDTGAWELLVELSGMVGQDEQGRAFADALEAELRHEAMVRSWLQSTMSENLKLI